MVKSKSLKATFIGHQTWLIECGTTKILIDPLLCEDFGLVDEFRIDIYPPRKVDVSALTDIDLIFLSHEHTDHFDIQSLDLLPRSAKFVVGSTIVDPVKSCIKSLGFDLFEVSETRPMQIKDLTLRFYPADPRTAFWEGRVTQILIESCHRDDGGIFIAVDALVSAVFKDEIKRNLVLNPKLIVVSNNSRTSPPGAFQSLENWGKNSAESNKKTGPLGVGVLTSVVASYLSDFPGQPMNVALCGGGFVKRMDNFAAFPFSEQRVLSTLANKLSLDINVVGLLPGEVLDLDAVHAPPCETDWIKLDRLQHRILTDELESFIWEGRSVEIASSVLQDIDSREEFERALSDAVEELKKLKKPLSLFITGKKALELGVHRKVRFGPKRLAFLFRCDKLGLRRAFALDFVTGNFEIESLTDEELLTKNYPYGVNIPLVDFLGMINGDIQIWDIVGVSVKSWFPGGIFEGIIPFFYCYYGENGSPELLAKIIRRKMSKLGVPA